MARVAAERSGRDGEKAEARGTSPLRRLLAVQDLDTSIATLRHRKATLPERADLRAAEAKLAELSEQVADSTARRHELLDRQGELERRVAALDVRRRAIEERMYGARGVAARDLQAMDDEVRGLASQRDRLEEEELELMEAQEPLDAALAELLDEQSALAEAVQGLRAALAAAEAAIEAELSTLELSRRAAAAGLPPDLARRYEEIRARTKGVGAARLVGNRCEGCHLELPAMEVDRIRRLPDDAVVTCEQCGRILVRAAAAGGPEDPACSS